MENFDSMMSRHINKLRSNYTDKKLKNALVLLNYMPIMRFLQPYEKLEDLEELQFYKDAGFEVISKNRDNVYRTVPAIKRVPAYAVIQELKVSKSNKSVDLLIRFQPRYNTTQDYPMLIVVNGEVYKNPNILFIKKALLSAHKASMLNRVITHDADVEWEVDTNSLDEIFCYNYITSDFKSMHDKANITNKEFRLDDNILKIYNTHMLMAQTELGYIYSTFRKKTSHNHTMDYCYNKEFVPIYFSMGINSILEQKTNNDVYWRDNLIKYIQPPDDMLKRYSSVPDCCKNIVVSDEKILKDINGSIINNLHYKSPIYYLSRCDHGLLSTTSNGNINHLSFSVPPDSKSNQRDTYNYRLTMPYLFSSLFKLEAVSGNNELPLFYGPEDWVIKITADDEDYIFEDSANDTHNPMRDLAISLDVVDSSDNNLDSVKRIISYKKFSFYSFNNYLHPDDETYYQDIYFKEDLVSDIVTTNANPDSLKTILSMFERQFLNVYFSRAKEETWTTG